MRHIILPGVEKRWSLRIALLAVRIAGVLATSQPAFADAPSCIRTQITHQAEAPAKSADVPAWANDVNGKDAPVGFGFR